MDEAYIDDISSPYKDKSIKTFDSSSPVNTELSAIEFDSHSTVNKNDNSYYPNQNVSVLQLVGRFLKYIFLVILCSTVF